MKQVLMGALILAGIVLLVFIGYTVMIISAFGGFDKDYSITDLKNNFQKHETEIYALVKYFNKIVPKNRLVYLEFEDDNTLGRFGVTVLDTATGNPNVPGFHEWDLKINTARIDSIIKPMGWTRETLKTLKEKLDDANCIGIESGDPTRIDFQRSGMGIYTFNVFDKPIPDSLRSFYNDSCTYILASDRLVLEYGGGAIGSQCFYNLK